MDNIYTKYCAGDQPVNEGGAEIEIEREADDSDTDSNTTEGSDVIIQKNFYTSFNLLSINMCEVDLNMNVYQSSLRPRLVKTESL